MPLTPKVLDALTELINIGVGRSAAILNEMLDSHVILRVPRVSPLMAADLKARLADRGLAGGAAIKMPFHGALQGVAALLFPPGSAAKIVSLLTGEQVGSPEWDPLRVETLNEVGNIVLNGVIGSIANTMEASVDYSLPACVELNVDAVGDEGLDIADTIIFAEAALMIQEHQIEGSVLLLFEFASFNTLLDLIQEKSV